MEFETNEIKLYEYDYDKPELSDETLTHHGITGMKWGVRNGPPYPLKSHGGSERIGGTGSGSTSKRKKRKTQKKRVKSLKKARKVREEKRKQAQEIQKSKDEIIKTKDISQMLKNVDKFSNQEINDMLTRLDTENKLRERVVKESIKKQTKGEKAVNFVKDSVKTGLQRGASSIISNVSQNVLEMGTHALVKAMASADNEDLVDKLFLGVSTIKKRK